MDNQSENIDNSAEERHKYDLEQQKLSLSLQEKLASLPGKPGVYQFKNDEGKIIYVGKAKSLKSRVRSYFQQGRPVDAKTKALVRKIADVDVIVVDTEAEALILENNLIKENKPRYNVLLKDDKTYPYVRVTNEPFPRIFPTRRVIRDGSKYFGPYAEGKHIRYVMKTIRSIFPIRSCDYDINAETIAKHKFRVCLDFHIGKCEGPCEGLVPREHYNEYIRQAMQFLNGRTNDVERAMIEQMGRLAEEMKFEQAAGVRNRLELLKEYNSKQKVLTTELVDRDIFALARVDKDAATVVFSIREGKLIGKKHFYLMNSAEETESEILSKTLERWYLETDFVPEEIFLSHEIESPDFLLDFLKNKRGGAVYISVPKIGEKKKLVSMAAANALFQLQELHIRNAQRDTIISRPVLSLQRDLRLSKPPLRIECFDNSHLQGTEYVSSLVVFEDGKPRKSDYRKFKLRTIEGNDDFAAMQEVVRRRYSRLIQDNEKLPDLIIIDGGKGQLSHAMEILRELGLADKIVVIGLAKRLEEVFFPGMSDSLLLPKTSSSLKLLQRVRDEAHRFAITYHRLLRDKRTFHTELTEVPGVGEKTAQKLLIEFGSVEDIKNTPDEELLKHAGKKAVAAIREYFKKQEEGEPEEDFDEEDEDLDEEIKSAKDEF
ncbi:MAG TPA: excinuclease ABC subunit UvrC [Patescibacteria group bacterium]|nr:excinuclease ABC subunit UvrC [Patescibacteria group bacterium]